MCLSLTSSSSFQFSEMKHSLTSSLFISLSLSAGPLEPEDNGKQDVSMSATPVYSELWFILLLALLGLFLLAILLGLVLQR